MPTAKKPTRTAGGQLGVVVNNVVSLRATADADSERVTQALIGEPLIIEGGQKDWYYVQTWDTYRGWIPSYAMRLLTSEPALDSDSRSSPSDEVPAYASSGPVAVIRSLWAEIREQPSDRAMILTKATVAAELEAMDDGPKSARNKASDWVELRLPDGRTGFVRRCEVKLVDKDKAVAIWLPTPDKIIETACRFIGVPYLWGGTSPFGLDCSGFVQLVHRIHGITLLRDAHMQAGDPRCQRVERADVRMGDLVFFGKPPHVEDLKAITHIGIAMDNDRFIHSGGRCGVHISRLSDPDSPYYERYWGARRMRFETLDVGGGAPET